MSVGRPMVQACMRASGGRENLEACRAQATPRVRACVKAALDKANGRANVAVAIPTEVAPKVAPGSAQPAGFVAPPRTITDITAILDSEKADLKTIEALKAKADAKPGREAGEDLAQFYFDRGNARAQLGRLADSIADAYKAMEVGRGTVSALLMGRFITLAAQQHGAAGDPKKAVEVYQRLIRETSNQRGARGFSIGANRAIATYLIQMGDIGQAEAYLRRSQPLLQEARTSGNPLMRAAYNTYGQNWEAEVEIGRAMIFEARGQYRDAETSYKLAEMRKRAAIKPMLASESPPSESSMVLAVDFNVVSQARVKARQGRLQEAEVDARRALLSQLKNQGKYNPITPRFVTGLADILVEQGRYAEAEQLVRVSLEIIRTVGIAEDSLSNVQQLSQLGNILNLQRKGGAAIAVFAQLDKAIANWEPARRQSFELGGGRITSLYAAGQVDAGIAAAEQLVKRQVSRVGENHADTALARGILAVGLMRAGRDAEAAREFRTAIPILMAYSRENADDDTTAVAARNLRLQNTVEAYLVMLAREKNASGEIGAETFSLADAIRGRSVQQALAASSARAAASDPALAELVRKEQDLGKQINAQLGTLNNVLSLSSAERDEKGVQAINASINALRADRLKAQQEIGQRFPAYAGLVSPKPPSVEHIRATLAEDEAMLSFYFGQNYSFVWAVPKSGPVAFAAIKASSGDIESKVRKLREALEPQAAMISDIPPFDLKLAHELYSLLLQPVESGWKPANNLIMVTNGALGLLPLSLLPTAPSEARSDDDPLFSSYKDVPWLARTHAITTVPSAAALRTLRQLPPGKAGRSELIAFGDPYFSKEQEAEAIASEKVRLADASGNTTRGGPLKRRNSVKLDGVDSAELAMLPRLPDTSEELKSIALALQADPSKVLNLGKQASEQAVKTMDLSGFKVLAFATHGLVPGELNGLSQPALAMSSPTVTGGEGDGLLTMEEILGLKLDADWVVLSACNTGTGAGAGAEAASGLGRAFFYAGTRALLVTNWSVHSQSARELVADLFKRQAQDPKLTRGEALRQAMMALIDGPGYAGPDGKTEFAYAHPLFWAPYSIIGDGGVR
ncbi:CHAT domain-containing tetratricopeptide repeat protein [Bradyrhizobium sp. BWA-3-5]|uniref:CHAT domain-containing protein n=1 Tax=Bradyrhizobium sp. BWA-3-5 TaxID=3080013 RepID=UPI00293E3ED1|nr:CHAT domain-containing tetratricopeptide repeat protein [Bradyrhizobium sp. BWA-3-5]WOH65531.1 CHAT domain-containing tetratricopeptide repeat protein [Bradyrhizobium sp. BWA-3-5]